MDENDKFNFEDEFDFPFYNGHPELSAGKWLILLGAIILVLLYIFLPFRIPFIPADNMGIILFILTFIPLYYVSNGNLGLFFRKLKRGDVKTIILCFIGYMLYATLMSMILGSLGLSPVSNGIVNANYDIHFLIVYFILIISEEFIKVILFLLCLYAVYKSTENRKLGIVASSLVTALIFGLTHYSAYSGNFAQIILIIGLGSLIDMYLYVKTKNLFATYILHLLGDFTIWSTAIVSIISTLIH